MKNKIIIIFIIIFILTGSIYSCKSISSFMQKEGTQKVFGKNFSNAVSASADAISTANEDITPEQEYYVGRAVAAKLLSTYKLYTKKPALTTYLNNICASITINSPRPDIYNGYHVAILDSNEINAFATPGGHIYVTIALVNSAKTEDALAGVIAHEIAHIQLQHGIKAIKNSRKTQAWLVTSTGFAATAGGTDVKQLTEALNETFSELVQTLVINGYSQDSEFEADNYALSLMAGAGYNPSGLTDMLMAIGSLQTSDAGFGKTHPSPAQRIANVQKSMGKYKVANTSDSRKKRFAAATK